MLSIAQINKTLDEHPIIELINDYYRKQEKNDIENSKVIQEFLSPLIFGSITDEKVRQKAAQTFRLSLIDAFYSLSPELQLNLLKRLNDFHYRKQCELILLIKFSDLLLLNQIDENSFNKLLFGLTSIKYAQITSSGIYVATDFGNGILKSASQQLGIGELYFPNRTGNCHNETTRILNKFPNLYGAYYYIPFEFAGYFDHSVIIDPKHNQVLDFANNIAIPLSLYQKYYPNYSFIIKGEDFIKIQEATFDHIGLKIGISTFEGIRRIRKKQEWFN